jgi:hypothetical protein
MLCPSARYGPPALEGERRNESGGHAMKNCRLTVPGGKSNYRAGAGLSMGTEIFAVPAD